MANVTMHTGINVDQIIADVSENALSGSVSYGSTLIRATSGIYRLDLAGEFFYSGGEPSGGTLNSATVYIDGVKALTIASLNVDIIDLLNTSSPENLFFGGADTFTGSSSADTMFAYNGNDTMNGNGGNDELFGEAGNDTIDGGTGNDELFGDAGTDTLQGGTGNDLLDGGDGPDTASYSTATSGVTVSLGLTGAQATGGAGSDTLVSIANLIGSAFADTLSGGTTNNSIKGGNGNDTINGVQGADSIEGGGGNDTIQGGVGNDTVSGGAGDDSFVFRSTLNASTNKDLITDFIAADDTIVLDNDIFTEIGFLGDPTSGGFVRHGTMALDASDRIIINDDTGVMYYDPDGQGGVAKVAFAVLGETVHPDITSGNFFVVD